MRTVDSLLILFFRLRRRLVLKGAIIGDFTARETVAPSTSREVVAYLEARKELRARGLLRQEEKSLTFIQKKDTCEKGDEKHVVPRDPSEEQEFDPVVWNINKVLDI